MEIENKKDIVMNNSIKRMPPSNFRELLSKVILARPLKIYMGKEDEEGDFEFSVTYKELNLTIEDLNKFESDILSPFFANFIGEMIVRENINDFMHLLTIFDSKEYNYKVNRFTHDNFGIRVEKGKMFFKFHLSFIQKVVTDNFKELVGHIEHETHEEIR